MPRKSKEPLTTREAREALRDVGAEFSEKGRLSKSAMAQAEKLTKRKFPESANYWGAPGSAEAA